MDAGATRPARLKVRVIILLSCVCFLWMPRLRLPLLVEYKYHGASIAEKRPYIDFLSEERATSMQTFANNKDDHTNTSTELSSPEISLSSSNITMSADEIFIGLRNSNNHNSSTNHSTENISLPLTGNWLPSDEWLQECVERGKNNTNNYKKSYRSQWPHYQLGDCLIICKSCPSSVTASKVKELSIVGHYWQNVCHEQEFSEKFNMSYLIQLFEKFDENPHPYSVPWRRPASDELVIHLRIGDVIDEARYSGKTSVYTMLRHGADTRHGTHSFYERGIKSVEEYLTTIRESGLEKVVLRGGSHFPKIYPKSRIYTKCLTEAIQQAGYTITSVQVDGESNPDQDFFYMSHAKHFVQATGGYSRLISQMVQHYGGRIIGRVPTQERNHTS